MLEAVKPISKAIAATLAGALVAWLMKQNVIIADGLQDSIEVVISAAIVGAVVYFAPKNTEGK